ncbi:MAG: FAD binding domain-containing protein [Halobacteriovoraceae bacterium]|nr:FAD binding domain-containing protein [Halobacteriovoraceae bacterium]
MIQFYLNGKLCEVDHFYSDLMLSDYIRKELCLTGTKVVCAEGDCGACTILCLNPLKDNAFFAINSCITPLPTVHGMHILTIESLENNDTLHPAQESILKNHATQCGFCTPGFAMSLAGLCEKKISKKENIVSVKECKNYLTGNLCRCTGLDSLVKAGQSMEIKRETSLKERYHTLSIENELLTICSKDLLIESENLICFIPTSYEKALDFLALNPDAIIMANATDLGVMQNKRNLKLKKFLSLHLIKESYDLINDHGLVKIGSKVSINSFRNFLEVHCQEYARYLNIFASPQIKNSATVVGNIANASPIGDNAPVLLSLDAELEIISNGQQRREKLSDFFINYKKTSLGQGEIIKNIQFNLPQNRILKFVKSSVRKDLDISTINLAFNIKLSGEQVEDALIAAGGVAPIPLRLKRTENFLIGTDISKINLEDLCEIALKEFEPISDIRGSSSYRRVLFKNKLKRTLGELR